VYLTNLKIISININKVVHNYVSTYDVVLYKLEIISVRVLVQELSSALSCARLEGVKVDVKIVFVLYEHPSRPYTKTNSIFLCIQDNVTNTNTKT
jgi:hypothetical protein